MAKQLFSIVLILLSWLAVNAQSSKQKKIDSLLIKLTNARDDTSKTALLARLATAYYQIDLKKGIAYGNQALELAEKINWKKGLELSYTALGTNYWANYAFINAQDYYGKALKVAQEINDMRGTAIALHDIGICYQAQNNYSKAIEYYYKGSELFEAVGDKQSQSGCFSNIADAYVVQGKLRSGIKFYQEALQISRQIKRERDVAYYSQQVGSDYTLLKNFDTALLYFKSAIQVFEKLKDYSDLARCRGILGDFYYNKRDYREAIVQYKLAIAIAGKAKSDASTMADFYEWMGRAYSDWAVKMHMESGTKKSYLELAAANLKTSMRWAKIDDYRQSVIESLGLFADVQKWQGNFAGALETYKAYITARDSLNNSEKDKEYKRHEQSFEYTRQRDSLKYAEKLQMQEVAQIKALAANKLRQRSLYAIVAIVVLLLIVSYFIFRSLIQQVKFKSQLAKEKSETEFRQIGFENKLNDLMLASLKSQMNPHFIFNCLNSIKFYVEKNDTEAASLYITKFSKLIRNILDSARSEKITLAEEIELISLYLEMEHMRLKEKLNYKFDIAKNIDIDFIEIPPLLIQPYVENAIWHGLMPKEKGGTLIVKVFADENYLVINIADNGIGREMAANLKRKSNLGHTSHGSTLNNERIAMFNAKYKTNTRVTITDLKDNAGEASGTLVTIKLLIQ